MVTKLLLTASLVTLAVSADGLYLGAADRPARWHGLAKIALVDGTSYVTAARVEDLGGRDYANRWHYVFTADPAAFAGFSETRHILAFVSNELQCLTVASWGQICMQPLDPEVRAWNQAASDRGVLDNPDGQDLTVTLRNIGGGNLWELLLEQPK